MTKKGKARRNLNPDIRYYQQRKDEASGKVEKAYWQRKIAWKRRILEGALES